MIVFVSDAHSEEGRVIERDIRSVIPQARVIYVDRRSAALEANAIAALLPTAQRIIAAVFTISQPGPAEIAATSASGLAAEGSAGILRNILSTAGNRTAVLAMGSPYAILNYPSIGTYLCAYSWLATSEQSAAKALLGQIPIHGKLPVTLPGIAKRGDGIDKD